MACTHIKSGRPEGSAAEVLLESSDLRVVDRLTSGEGIIELGLQRELPDKDDEVARVNPSAQSFVADAPRNGIGIHARYLEVVHVLI